MKKLIAILVVVLASCGTPYTPLPDEVDRAPAVGSQVTPYGYDLVVLTSPENYAEVTLENYPRLQVWGKVAVIPAPEFVTVEDVYFEVKTVYFRTGQYQFQQHTLCAVKIKNTDGTPIGWVPAWNVRF